MFSFKCYVAVFLGRLAARRRRRRGGGDFNFPFYGYLSPLKGDAAEKQEEEGDEEEAKTVGDWDKGNGCEMPGPIKS